LPKGRNDARKNPKLGRRVIADRQLPYLAVRRTPRERGAKLRVGKGFSRLGQKCAPSLRYLGASPLACQKIDSDLLLQLANLHTQGRRSDFQARRRARKVQLLRDGDKVA